MKYRAVREVSIPVTAPFFPHARLEFGTGLTQRPGELLALRIDEVAQAHAVPDLLDRLIARVTDEERHCHLHLLAKKSLTVWRYSECRPASAAADAGVPHSALGLGINVGLLRWLLGQVLHDIDVVVAAAN